MSGEKYARQYARLNADLWAPTIDGRGMVSLATRQTPQIDDNTPARMVLSSFFTIFQSMDPLSTARG